VRIETVATASITASTIHREDAWLRIQLGSLDQFIQHNRDGSAGISGISSARDQSECIRVSGATRRRAIL
jgi:hypothetical protein